MKSWLEMELDVQERIKDLKEDESVLGIYDIEEQKTPVLVVASDDEFQTVSITDDQLIELYKMLRRRFTWIKRK